MYRYGFIISTLFVVIFFNGCTQKVKIRALEPAKIDRASDTKKIAVVAFKNDRVGLSAKIEINLSKYKIDNKSFFTMLNRSDINKIIKEQKLQNSGLIDSSTVVDIGNLIGAEAIISGNVSPLTSSDSYFYETRTQCRDKKCKELIYYKVRCIKRVVSVSAEIRMIDVSIGDVIYGDNISKTSTYEHCKDDSYPLPSKEMAAQKLTIAIASDFTYKLTPHYRYFYVELLQDPDLNYNNNQKFLLKSSLEYIKHNRYEKAERLLIDLINSTAEQSYVAFYNLGIIKEAQGKYAKAKEYYKKADNLVIKPIEVIDEAYLRIDSVIEKYHKTQNQLNR